MCNSDEIILIEETGFIENDSGLMFFPEICSVPETSK